METLRTAPGFFGPNTSLLTDITLIVQIVFYLLLCAGVVAQLQSKYKLHDALQMPVVILNLFFIAFVMAPTFFTLSGSLPAEITRPPVLVTATHAMLGTVAQLLSLYCLLAGMKILPRKIGVLRYWMWGAFVAWTAAVVFGIGVYIVFYANPFASPTPPPPAQNQPGSEIISEHDEPPAPTEPAPTVSVATSTSLPAPTPTPAAVSTDTPTDTPAPEPTVTPTPELIAPPPTDDTTAEHNGG